MTELPYKLSKQTIARRERKAREAARADDVGNWYFVMIAAAVVYVLVVAVATA